VDSSSWKLHKIGSSIHPHEVCMWQQSADVWEARQEDVCRHRGCIDCNMHVKLAYLHPPPHPLQVMVNGSQSMHAVSDAGVSVSSASGDEVLQIRTLDAPLVSPGHPTVLPQGRHAPGMSQGVHFNLVNNMWGTNYVSDALCDACHRSWLCWEVVIIPCPAAVDVPYYCCSWINAMKSC
jgi:hypothetical protein